MKASAAQHKSGIQAVEVEQNRLSGLVTQKKEERPVECEWIYECSGFDAGTGKMVEVRDILQDERSVTERMVANVRAKMRRLARINDGHAMKQPSF